ncbi:MAG: hypothetical protein WAM03_02445, partial [Pseudolabrys sp.]
SKSSLSRTQTRTESRFFSLSVVVVTQLIAENIASHPIGGATQPMKMASGPTTQQEMRLRNEEALSSDGVRSCVTGGGLCS